MTAFSSAQLPASIDTVEELVVWGTQVLFELYANQTASEGEGLPPRVIQSGVYYIPATNSNRSVSRLSLGVESNYASSGNPIWKSIQPLGSDAIPTRFLAQ